MRHASKVFIPLLAISVLSWGIPAEAASHREAPLIALDPSADNTDVYAFVNYDQTNLDRAPGDRRVTFILNVNPGPDPITSTSMTTCCTPSTSTTTGTGRPMTSSTNSASRPRTGRSSPLAG